MPSLAKRGENYSVRFTDPSGKRHDVALATSSQERAQRQKRRIAKLVAHRKAGESLDDELVLWVSRLPAELRDKLEACGLLDSSKPKNSVALGSYLREYAKRRTDVKSATLTNWGHTIRNLTDFFGHDRDLATITKSHAKDFRVYLQTKASTQKKKLSSNTIRKRIANAKLFFGDAVDREVIPSNPFHGMESATRGNPDRQFFVTLEMAQSVLDACSDREWLLLFALSRFGGLRCPSEHLQLRLDDIDWERERIVITSPKTEHHKGKAKRMIPLFPQLRPFIEECWDAAEPGQEYFITRYRSADQNLRTQLIKIIKRAGLVPSPGQSCGTTCGRRGRPN